MSSGEIGPKGSVYGMDNGNLMKRVTAIGLSVSSNNVPWSEEAREERGDIWERVGEGGGARRADGEEKRD